MGYTWHTVFRQTPLNGSALVIDTHAAFSDLGGPQRLGISYTPDQTRREDVNRRGASRTWGFRFGVRMHVYIDTMQDSVHLFDILNRLVREDWSTEISLNGGGSYIEMELDNRFTGPDGFRGKTVSGAEFELAFRSKDLLPEVPYIAALITPLAAMGGPSRPPASSAYKWVIWTNEGPPDSSAQCVRNPAGAWEWREFVSG